MRHTCLMLLASGALLALLLGASLLPAGQPGAVSRPAPAASQPALTPAELLERVQDAYRRLAALRCDYVVTAPPSIRVRAIVEMAPGRLRTRVFVQDAGVPDLETEQPICEFLIRDGIVTEHRYRCGGIADLVLRYPAPYVGGTHTHFLDRDLDNYGCLFARVLQSWLGAESDTVTQFLPRFIGHGTLGPPEVIGDRLCYVVSWGRMDQGRWDVLYFDTERYLLRQWDTYDANQGPDTVLSRSRRVTNIRFDPLPEETWQLELPAALRCAPTGVVPASPPALRPGSSTP